MSEKKTHGHVETSQTSKHCVEAKYGPSIKKSNHMLAQAAERLRYDKEVLAATCDAMKDILTRIERNAL